MNRPLRKGERMKCPTNIYVASKTVHAPMWIRFREWANSGIFYKVISTWIDESGAGETEDRSELAERCIKEIKKSDLVVVYRKNDEILKGAWVEVGIALAFKKVVILVGDWNDLSSPFIESNLVVIPESYAFNDIKQTINGFANEQTS